MSYIRQRESNEDNYLFSQMERPSQTVVADILVFSRSKRENKKWLGDDSWDIQRMESYHEPSYPSIYAHRELAKNHIWRTLESSENVGQCPKSL